MPAGLVFGGNHKSRNNPESYYLFISCSPISDGESADILVPEPYSDLKFTWYSAPSYSDYELGNWTKIVELTYSDFVEPSSNNVPGTFYNFHDCIISAPISEYVYVRLDVENTSTGWESVGNIYKMPAPSVSIHLAPYDRGVGIGMYSGDGLKCNYESSFYQPVSFLDPEVSFKPERLSITFKSGWNHYDTSNGDEVYLYRIGPMVFLNGKVRRTGSGVTTGDIFTIDDPRFWPSCTIQMLVQGSNSYIAWIQIKAGSGTAYFSRYRPTNSITFASISKDSQLTFYGAWVARNWID